MRLFKLDGRFNVLCESKGNRAGFKHEAKLFSNGHPVQTISTQYSNRTWESYQFETVLKKAINKFFEGSKRDCYLEQVKGF